MKGFPRCHFLPPLSPPLPPSLNATERLTLRGGCRAPIQIALVHRGNDPRGPSPPHRPEGACHALVHCHVEGQRKGPHGGARLEQGHGGMKVHISAVRWLRSEREGYATLSITSEKRGRGGEEASGTQEFVYQKWPEQTLRNVIVVSFSRSVVTLVWRGGGKGGFGTRPRYRIVCPWRPLLASHHRSF